MSSYLATCVRCGVRHAARKQEGYVCLDCKFIRSLDVRGLPKGEWVLSGGIRRFVPDQSATIGRPRKPQRWSWTVETATRAHGLYNLGERNDWTREGERIYSRWAKSRRRPTTSTRDREAA